MNQRRIPFNVEDEERIASAAIWGIIVAVTTIASAIVGLFFPLMFSSTRYGLSSAQNLGQIFGSLFWIIPSIMLLQASLKFRKVALTDEADQQYLIEGFSKLRNYFKLIGILMLFALGAIIMAFCGMTAFLN